MVWDRLGLCLAVSSHSPLEPRYLPLIVVALAAWLFLVRFFWRGRLIEPYLGVRIP
ncbi:MAG TPA: hypothetical protein VNL35_07255 [Chloroflexota bacterium]|nr:hypothetical protein [Chloroflexota bacterium]